jgi:hypothetical protein
MKKFTILALLSFGFFLLSTSIVAQRTGEQIDKSGHSRAGLVVSPINGTTVTPSDLVEKIIGTGITYSNVSYTGANIASGLFTGGTSAGLGLDDGLILSSGLATNAIGPNVSPSISAENNVAGDSDLDALIPQSTYDASVLEFDFVPTKPNLEIRFVFGSEEYNEYVTSPFNDVFAFFLDGVNIALIPYTAIPVAINNVNNGWAAAGSSATGPCSYCSYYMDNAVIPGSPHDTEMDGYTTLIIGTATVTLTRQTHHIKLAIADAGDYALDSWVLIEGDSFGPPPGVPVSNWAIYIGIFLIAAFMVFRFRRRLA